jgi:hypothetical protein
MLGMAALHQLGTKVVARLSLRGLSEAERASRMAKFHSTLLSRALLVLYIVYPGACKSSVLPCGFASKPHRAQA